MPQGMERSEPTGAMGPPPLPNKAVEQDRGRKNDNDRSTRANSLPAANRRPVSRESAIASLRKPSAPFKDSQALHTPASSSKVSSTDPNRRQISDPFQVIFTPGTTGLRRTRSRLATALLSLSPQRTRRTSSQTVPWAPVGEWPLQPSEHHYLGAAPRPQGDYVREGRPQKTRDWARDKTDTVNATEKVGEIGKIATTRANPVIVVESEMSEDAVATVAQEGATTPTRQVIHTPLRFLKTASKFPSMGLSQQIVPARRRSLTHIPLQLRTAINPRSYSGPLNAGYQGGYYDNSTGMTQAMSPVQTDMSGYNLQGQMPMLSSPMSAAPFGSHLNSFGVMSMVMGQV